MASADADIIPATGYLDSTAILELVVWYEQTYDFPLKQEEINIDNLGSIDAMTDFLLSRKACIGRLRGSSADGSAEGSRDLETSPNRAAL